MAQINMILTNGFDPDSRVYKEAKYLVEQGHKVEIHCWDRELRYLNEQDVMMEGFRIIRYGIGTQPGSGFKQLPAFFKFIKKCRTALKSAEYDYLHCHDLDGMLVGYFAKNKTAKLVFDMHEYYENGKLEKIYVFVRAVIRFLQNKSYKIIYVNETQTKEVRQKNIDKLVYLPNYPEKEIFKPAEKTFPEVLRVTYTGYVRDYGAFSMLLAAVGNDPRFHIAINGIGGCYEQVKLDAEQYNNVEVTGEFDYNDIADFYNCSDITFCLYNNKDKNHNTCIAIKFYESILFLTPILVAKETAMEEMCIKYKIGQGIDSSVEGVREALEYLYDNREVLESYKENMRKIQFDFSWEAIVTKLDDIYRV